MVHCIKIGAALISYIPMEHEYQWTNVSGQLWACSIQGFIQGVASVAFDPSPPLAKGLNHLNLAIGCHLTKAFLHCTLFITALAKIHLPPPPLKISGWNTGMHKIVPSEIGGWEDLLIVEQEAVVCCGATDRGCGCGFNYWIFLIPSVEVYFSTFGKDLCKED